MDVSAAGRNSRGSSHAHTVSTRGAHPDARALCRRLGTDIAHEKPTPEAIGWLHTQENADGAPLLNGQARPRSHNAPEQLVVSAKQNA